MSKWKIGIAVAILSVLMFITQGMLMSKEGFATVRATKQDGWWMIWTDERVPRDEADAMIVADGQIFLFYEDVGLVNAYSTEGKFLRGYQIETVGNGVGGIGYHDGVLYINGKSGVYGFRGGELVVSEVMYRDEAFEEIKRILDAPDPVKDGGYTYYYNAAAGEINRSKPGEALETVVRLPVKDSNVDVLIYANLALLFGFATMYRGDDGKVSAWFEAYRRGRRHSLR